MWEGVVMCFRFKFQYVVTFTG